MSSPIHGRAGRLYVAVASGGTAAPMVNMTGWSINFSTDRKETTVLGDTNKTYASGLPDAQGDFKGFYDTASAQAYTAASDGVARKFYLYPSTDSAGTYWFGTGLFDFKLDGSVDDTVNMSGSWAAASAVIKVG